MQKSSNEDKEGISNIGFDCEQVQRYIPLDLQSKVTILLQDSGYVTISPRGLSRLDWRRLNNIIKQIGGVWISDGRFSHWSIPFS